MREDAAIFIFTRDRPERLKKTLTFLEYIQYKIVIIDDSASIENCEAVKGICHEGKNREYFGKKEFLTFLSRNELTFEKHSFLIRELGHSKWNLGYARNAALLYSKSLKVERVLFVDDDIEVSDTTLIDELFTKLKNYKFTGAHIMGLVDDSVLGHIATDINVSNPRMLSGGFMAFNPNMVDHFFLNNYNEDWIWLFLQNDTDTYLQTGEVFQELADPLLNYQQKIFFQEFGEIVLDGILDLYSEKNYAVLKQPSFWQRILLERTEYLETLYVKAKADQKVEYLEMIKHISIHTSTYNSLKFAKLFDEYFNNRNAFKEIFKTLT